MFPRSKRKREKEEDTAGLNSLVRNEGLPAKMAYPDPGRINPLMPYDKFLAYFEAVQFTSHEKSQPTPTEQEDDLFSKHSSPTTCESTSPKSEPSSSSTSSLLLTLSDHSADLQAQASMSPGSPALSPLLPAKLMPKFKTESDFLKEIAKDIKDRFELLDQMENSYEYKIIRDRLRLRKRSYASWYGYTLHSIVNVLRFTLSCDLGEVLPILRRQNSYLNDSLENNSINKKTFITSFIALKPEDRPHLLAILLLYLSVLWLANKEFFETFLDLKNKDTDAILLAFGCELGKPKLIIPKALCKTKNESHEPSLLDENRGRRVARFA